MIFKPIHRHVVGRVLVAKASNILHHGGDITKGVAKFVLIDELSQEAIEAGYALGDVILPENIKGILMKGGTFYRAAALIDVVICRPPEVDLDDFTDVFGKPVEDFYGKSVKATAKEDTAA